MHLHRDASGRQATAPRLLGLLVLTALLVLALTGTALAAPPTITDVDFFGYGSGVIISIYGSDGGESTDYTVEAYDLGNGEFLGEATFMGGPAGTIYTTADCSERYMSVHARAVNKDGADDMTVDDRPKAPQILPWNGNGPDFYRAAVGARVDIRGSDFGPFHDHADFFFMPGSLKAEIIQWGQGGYIAMEVPVGAKDGTIHVTTLGGQSNDFPFDVESTVTGNVVDGHSGLRGHPLQDAKVELKIKKNGELLDTGYTDAGGDFELSHELEKDTTYRLTVTLETEDHRLLLKDSGTTVSFSRDFTYLSTDEDDRLPMCIRCDQVGKIAEASVDKGHIDNLGSVWHYLQVNRKVAKLAGCDLASPVIVNAYVAGRGAWYSFGSKSISLTAETVNDDTTDGWPPPWQFIKNRESHEFGHALMHSAMGGSTPASPSKNNHDGYVNDNTGDSLTEGFAEFWTMYMDNVAGIDGQPGKYDGWGYLASTNARKAWSPLRTATPTADGTGQSEEEFAVAGILYRIWLARGGDEAAFGEIVDALPSGGTFTDWHDDFAAGGGGTSFDDDFFTHGFFSDTDGDWTHDAGEPLGAGNGATFYMAGWTIDARLDRRTRPYEPNAFVGVDLKGVPGPASESQVTVEIKHPADPAADFSQETLVPGSMGLVYVYLEPGATAEVSVTGADDVQSADSLSFTYDEWVAARSAVASGAAITRTFKVDQVSVGNPVAPKTMSHTKAATVTGTLEPRHLAGTFPVLVYKYRLVAGRWKSMGYVKAKAADFSTFSRYSCRVKLPYAGKWRLRAKAVADAEHKATWSRGYDVVRVK